MKLTVNTEKKQYSGKDVHSKTFRMGREQQHQSREQDEKVGALVPKLVVLGL